MSYPSAPFYPHTHPPQSAEYASEWGQRPSSSSTVVYVEPQPAPYNPPSSSAANAAAPTAMRLPPPPPSSFPPLPAYGMHPLAYRPSAAAASVKTESSDGLASYPSVDHRLSSHAAAAAAAAAATAVAPGRSHQKAESSAMPERGTSIVAANAAAVDAADGGKEQQRKALRRNMACHQKLKCDSLRPQCTPCSKARQSFLESLPPGMDPPEMSCLCTYDEMNGPFKKSVTGGGSSRRQSHTVEHRTGGKRAHEIDGEDEDGGVGGNAESSSERRLEAMELENAQLKAQLSQLSLKLNAERSPPREYHTADGALHPQGSPTFLVSPQPYATSPYEHSPPHATSHLPLQTQHLSASWTQTPPPPPPPPPASPPPPSFHPSSTQGPTLAPTLPPLLHPPQPPPRPRPDSHLHYPFLNHHQQQQFLLPLIQPPLSPGGDVGGGGLYDNLVHPFDLSTGDVNSALGDREGVIKALGGLEALEVAIGHLYNVPLMRHVWPPFKTKYPTGPPSPIDPRSSPTSTASSTSYTTAPYSLLSRLHLPPDSPMRIHVSLLLAISAFKHRGTENAQVWAIEAGREIMFAKLAGISGEEESDARARERKAIDVVQAATLLIALHHFEGSWAEFHNFAPVASLLSDLLGLDPIRAPMLPEYSVSVLRRPNPADDTFEERRRTVQCAKFVHNVYLVFSARGTWDVTHDVSLRYGEELTSTPILLSLSSIYLVARVDQFNKTLRPPVPPSAPNASLLETLEDQVAFQLLENDVDAWCGKLGRLQPSDGIEWEGEYGMGELLGGKVLAEHARLLLYCVHLNNSSSDSQRRACLAAAQSISQSCVVASSIPPLAVPSFCLHSYFLAAQILLRFLASAQLNHDDWLVSQLTQQVSVIKHTFERLSTSYRVARNFHKLLEAAMTEGSGVIPQSFAMVFDLAFYTPK